MQGKNEMNQRGQTLNENYKSKLCKNFHKFFNCSYGFKCNFIHNSEGKCAKICIYEKLNNLKSSNPIDLIKNLKHERLLIFKVICKFKTDNESESYDLESLSTNDEREKNDE